MRIRALSPLATISAFSIASCSASTPERIGPTAVPTQPALSSMPPRNTEAEMITQTLDSMQVETHWLRGVGGDWLTGEPNGKQVPASNTHCSAFVAAASLKLGVYILRPPEHKTTLLANAQNEWLRAQGAAQGWVRVEDGMRAQELANQGHLVVASYKNPDPKKHGHIAIIRPSDKSIEQILVEGPQIIQAGGTNYTSTSLKQGFMAHPRAFPNNRIQFFAHKITLPLANKVSFL